MAQKRRYIFAACAAVLRSSDNVITTETLADLAHGFSGQPEVGCVEKSGEWYRDKNEKEVTSSQTDNEHVRLGSHRFVGENHVDESCVADQSHNEHDTVNCRENDSADINN